MEVSLRACYNILHVGRLTVSKNFDVISYSCIRLRIIRIKGKICFRLSLEPSNVWAQTPHMSILLEIELYVTHGLGMLVSYHFTLILKCQLTPPWLRKQLIMIMKCVLKLL